MIVAGTVLLQVSAGAGTDREMGFGKRQEIENLKRDLIHLPNVLGVGEFVTDDEICLKLFFVNQQVADAFEIPGNDHGIQIYKATANPQHSS